MTVLFILDFGTVGGATKAFEWMIRQLRSKGINVLVVTGKYNEFNKSLEHDGFKTISAGHYTAIEPINFNLWYWPYSLIKRIWRYHIHEFLAMRKLERELDFSTIDIIHTNSARNTLGCRLSKKFGIPHVVHIREFGDKDFNCVRFTPNYYTLLNNHTNIFLTVSKAVKKYWIAKGIEPNKTQLLYDGVYHQDITLSSNDGKKHDKIRMVINGGVFPTKGQHLVVEAMGYLPENIRKLFYLDVAGWFSEKYVEEMKSYAKEKGYNHQINFLGPIDDVHQRMGDYQIGLMCSKAEGFGLVTAEYMFGQLGVIASDSGACPELIDDGRTGLLFKSGDSADLARCLEKLYNDRDLLVKLSNNAREDALKRFTAEINANNIYKVYQEILNN